MYVDVEGINTYFLHEGSGQPLVLLHGQGIGACAEVCWSSNIGYFANSGFAVYAFDQVGFGRTGDRGDFSADARVAHARGFLQAMRLPRYALWGQSSGSEIAARVAVADPQVRGLILMACGSMAPRLPGNSSVGSPGGLPPNMPEYLPSRENARRYLMGTFVKKDRVSEELVERVFAMSSGRNLESYQARITVPRPQPVHDKLPSLNVPTLLLWGKDDRVSVERGILLFRLIPGAEMHVFDNCGHWVQIDQEQRVHQLSLIHI